MEMITETKENRRKANICNRKPTKPGDCIKKTNTKPIKCCTVQIKSKNQGLGDLGRLGQQLVNPVNSDPAGQDLPNLVFLSYLYSATFFVFLFYWYSQLVLFVFYCK